MDGQNFNNEGSTQTDVQNTGYYQDNTVNNAQYQNAVYATQPEEQSGTNGMAIASLVLGIISILLSCCYGVGALFGIVGLILAIISKKQGKSGVGTAGLICSILGLVASIVMIILVAVGVAAILQDPSLYYDYYY